MNESVFPKQANGFIAVEPDQAAELLKSFVKDTQTVPGRRLFSQKR